MDDDYDIGPLRMLVCCSADKELLRAYLTKHKIDTASIDFVHDVNAHEKVFQAARSLLPDEKKIFFEEVKRLDNMADDGHQLALHSVIKNKAAFETQGSQCDRSLWALRNEPKRFLCAEAYFDFTRFQGKPSKCRQFYGVPGLTLSDIEACQDQLAEALRHALPGGDKLRIVTYGHVGVDKSIQFTLYKQHLTIKEPDFAGDDLIWAQRIPVYNYTIFYNPMSGTFDVVARYKDEREIMATVFSHCVLKNGKPVPVPQDEYDLSILLKKQEFSLGDGMVSFVQKSLKVANYDQGLAQKLETLSKGDCIYVRTDALAEKNPLKGRSSILEGEFTVVFDASGPGNRCKTETFKITPTNVTLSNGLDEPEQRVLRNVYLPLWGFIRKKPKGLI